MTDPIFRAGPDALAARLNPERLFFADGAFLSQDDFTAEQTYHRGRLARALAYLHGAGTIAGLDVDIAPRTGADAEIRVEPGLALDRLGRLVELNQPACLRIGPWFEDQAKDEVAAATLSAGFREGGAGLGAHVLVDVFVAFWPCARAPQPAFATGNADHLDAVQFSRVLDGAALSLVVRPVEIAEGAKLPRQRVPDLSGAADEAARAVELRRFKREDLWDLLQLDLQLDPPRLPWPEDDAAHEYVFGMEGSEIMLARLRLPASRTAPAALPVFDAAANVADGDVMNDLRLFSYGTAELALLLGL